MKKSLFVYSLTLLALAFAACSDNAKKADDDNNECVGEDCGTTPDIVATPLVRQMASQNGCALDMDCAEGAFCFNGQCVIQCSTSLAIDCETGYLCDDTRGRCVTTNYISELKKIEDQIEAAGDSMSDSDKAALRASIELKTATEGNVRRSVLGQKNEKDATVEGINFARRMDSAVLFNPNAQSQTVSFKTKDSIGDVLYAVKMEGVDLPLLKKSTGVENSDGSYTYNFEIETSKILQSRRLKSKLRSGGDIEPDATVVDIVSNAGTFQSEIVDPIDASGIYEGEVIPEAVLSGTPLPIRMGIQTTPEKVSSFTDITDITLILPVSGGDLFSPETPTADGKESWASLKMSKKSAAECGSNTPCFAADFSTNDYAPAGSQLFNEDQHVNRNIRIEIFDFDAPSLTFTGRIVDRLKGLYRIASIQEGNIHREWNDTSMVGGFSVTLANSIDDSVSIHEHQSENEAIRESDENPVDICTTNDIKALISKIEDPFTSCDTVTDVDEKARCEAIKKCKTVSSKSAFDALEADEQWACVQYIASGITNDNARLSNILAQVLEADVTGNNTSDPIVTVCGKDIHNFAEFQSVCDDKTCDLCKDHSEYICEADLLARAYLKNQLNTDEQASVMTAWTSVIRESYLAQQYLAWNNDNKIRREWLEGAVYTGTFAASTMDNFNERLLKSYREDVLDTHRSIMGKQFKQSTLEMISQSFLSGGSLDAMTSARNTILSDLAQTWESVSTSLGLSARRYDVLSQNDKKRIDMAKELRPYVFDLYFAAVLETEINLKADQGSLNASFGANMGNIMSKLDSLDQGFESLVFMRDGEVFVDTSLDTGEGLTMLGKAKNAAKNSVEKAIAKREAVFKTLDEQKTKTLSIQDSYVTSLEAMRAEIVNLCGYPTDCKSDTDRQTCKIFTDPYFCGFALSSTSAARVDLNPADAPKTEEDVKENSISQNINLNDCIQYKKATESTTASADINKACSGGNLELVSDAVSYTEGTSISEAGLAILEYREADQDYQTALAEYEVLRQKVANNFATADAYATAIGEWYDERSEHITSLKNNLAKMKDYEDLITEYNNNVSQAELEEMDQECKLQADANFAWYQSAASNLAFQTAFQTIITGNTIADIWVSKAAKDHDDEATLSALKNIVTNTSLKPDGGTIQNSVTRVAQSASAILGTASAALQTANASAEGVANIAQMGFDFNMEKLSRDTDDAIAKKQQDLAHRLADDMDYFKDDKTVQSLKVACGESKTCDADELEALIADLKRDNEQLQLDLDNEQTRKRDMQDLEIMRNEFKNVALDLLPLAHTVKVKEIAKYRALIKYLTIVQRAQLVASQYDGKLARYQLMQNAVFSASNFFQTAHDLESVEAFIEYSRNDLSDYLTGIEYLSVRPFVELRRSIYMARGTNDFEKLYEQLNDLTDRCGSGTASTNKVVLSLREQLGIPDGEIDGLTPEDRFHLVLAKGNLPVSAQTRYTVTASVADELKAGSYYSGSFNISTSYGNIGTSCNAKIDSIEIRFISKEGKKIRESGTTNPVVSLFYGGQAQLLSCHSNIDAIVSSIGGRTTYGKFSTFNIKPFAGGINAGVYEIPEGEKYTFSDSTDFTGVTNYKDLSGYPMVATYTVVFDPSKGNNDKINWDNVADIELQINYTTGSLGMNSDKCTYDIEG